MKIKFLAMTKAPQEVYRTHCECCGPEMDGWIEQWFTQGEIIDPDENMNKVDLTGLQYRVDYDIVEYP